ncbi:hypothetical protein [Geosporobacter ferrireducens]|uniref:GAF domain-containing protein n=1 Tax=Geosporobacter ferrireducens TaxID=1424294 RepID=A0A1D8GEV9_9FIRM|nr:hypothetical protein [Geosporobacter ferrireducens]AOT69428.1 hypothetical protein Gferi_07500 [Geosporobacter ferrireducens]MTI56543.1 hypothetical protein [Geosporobacter ferrireducens]
MEDVRTTHKVYRYEVLLQAIDFFTQRFNLDQLGAYAFDFTNEILTLNSSALFIREGDNYVLKNARLYEIKQYSIAHNRFFEDLPVLHGDIITNRFDTFFSEEVIKDFNIQLVIPLVIHDYLYGFIISNGKILGNLEEDDRVIASSLTKLFRNSLENSKQIHELYLKTKELDQKIFNLFAINQSAKSLLSEVNLDKLYSLATDIFSEITCSKVTSFGVYDSISKSIKVLGYRNVHNYTKFLTELHISNRSYHAYKIVLDIEKDLESIQTIFTNWEEFYALQAKYVILLVKDEILGVITLSEAVNDRLYDDATFELVETLASFTHIAISNALLFKEMLTQKERVERKFSILDTLNRVIRTVNLSNSIEELSDLVLKVLTINFGIKKAFFAYQDQEKYAITHSIGLEDKKISFTINDAWQKAQQRETIQDFHQGAIKDFFEESLVDVIGSSNCLVISPMGSGSSCAYEKSSPMGFLVVIETRDSLKEEEVLLIDTIVKNISPIVTQMRINQQIKQEYQKDPVKEFFQAVEKKITERQEFDLEFYVYFRILNKNPFEEVQYIPHEGTESFVVSNYIFLLSYETIDNNHFCNVPRFETVEELCSFDYHKLYACVR